MTTISATDLRNNFFKMLKTCAKYNEPINIHTKTGNLILLTEEEYEGLRETTFLNGIPKMRKDIINGLKTPLSECREINLETI
ncbi:MAG: type II toxin-antitoxin system Phd/YefM family antitoxin [Endomicrobium sp.]|nr:type II toxin-antitoxin system Phd/YefM family antitoxin [Endomicrobium sp.]